MPQGGTILAAAIESLCTEWSSSNAGRTCTPALKLLCVAYQLEELRNFIITESGKAEASTGHYDDMVMSLAIACEAYRTHGHALTNKSFSWGEMNTLYKQPDTKWL